MIENIEILKFLIEGDATGLIKALNLTDAAIARTIGNLEASAKSFSNHSDEIVDGIINQKRVIKELQAKAEKSFEKIALASGMTQDEIAAQTNSIQRSFISMFTSIVNKAKQDNTKIQAEFRKTKKQTEGWLFKLSGFEEAGRDINQLFGMIENLHDNQSNWNLQEIQDYKHLINQKITEEARYTSEYKSEQEKRKSLQATKVDLAAYQVPQLASQLKKIDDPELKSNLQKMITDFIGGISEATKEEVDRDFKYLKHSINKAVDESKEAISRVKTFLATESKDIGRFGFLTQKKGDLKGKLETGKIDIASADKIVGLMSSFEQNVKSGVFSTQELDNIFKKLKIDIKNVEQEAALLNNRLKGTENLEEARSKISGKKEIYQSQIKMLQIQGAEVEKIENSFDRLFNNIDSEGVKSLKQLEESLNNQLKLSKQQLAIANKISATGHRERSTRIDQEGYINEKQSSIKHDLGIGIIDKKDAFVMLGFLNKFKEKMEDNTLSTHELDEEFKKLKHSIKTAEKQSSLMNDQFQRKRKLLYDLQNAGQTMAFTFGFAFLAIARHIQVVLKTFSEFEEKINKFKGISFKPGQNQTLFDLQTKQYEDNVLRIASGSKFMASEVAEAGIIMTKLGFNTEQVNSSLETIVLAAEASGESIERVGEVISGVIEGFQMKQGGLQKEEVEGVADVLTKAALESAADISSLGETLKEIGPISLSAGQDFAQTTALVSELGKKMIVGSKGATTLKNAILRLIRPTPQAQAALNALGVQTIDPITGDMRDMHLILVDLANSMRYMGNGSRNAALDLIFGKRAVAGMSAVISEILVDQDAFTNRIEENAEAAKGLTKTVKDISFQGFAAEIAKLRSEFNEFQIQLGEIFGYFLGKYVIVNLREFISALNDAPTALKQVIATLTGGTGIAFAGLAVVGVLVKVVSGLKMVLLMASKFIGLTPVIGTFISTLTAGGGLTAAFTGAALAAGPFVFAIAAIGIALAGVHQWMKVLAPIWAEEARAQEANRATLALQIEARERFNESLAKQRKGLIKNVEDLKAEAYEYNRKSVILNEQLKKMKLIQQVVDSYNDKKGAFGSFILTQEQLDAFKKLYPELIQNGNQLQLHASDIERLSAQTSNYIDITENLVGQYNKLSGAAKDAIPGAEQHEAAIKAINENRLELESLQKLYEDAPTQELKLEYEKLINKKIEERAALIKEANKQNLDPEQVKQELEESEQKQQEIQDIMMRQKAGNKDILELMKEQNKQRELALDLAVKEAELQNEIALNRQLGIQSTASDLSESRGFIDELAKLTGVNVDAINKAVKEKLQQDTKTSADILAEINKTGKIPKRKVPDSALSEEVGESGGYIPSASSEVDLRDYKWETGSNFGMGGQEILTRGGIYNDDDAKSDDLQRKIQHLQQIESVQQKNKKTLEEKTKKTLKDLDKQVESLSVSRSEKSKSSAPPSSSYAAPKYSSAPSNRLYTGTASDEAAERMRDANKLAIDQSRIEQELNSLHKQRKQHLEQINTLKEQGNGESQEAQALMLEAAVLDTQIRTKEAELAKIQKIRYDFDKKYAKEVFDLKAELARKDLELAVEMAQLTLGNFKDDMDAKSVLSKAQIESEFLAEKEKLQKILDAGSEFNEQLQKAKDRRDKKIKINDFKLAKEKFDMERAYAESLFNLQQKLDTMRVNFMTNDYEKAMHQISLAFEADKFDIQGKIDDPTTSTEQKEKYKELLKLREQQRDKDVATAGVEARSKELELERELYDLSIQRNQAARDMLEIQDMLMNDTGVTSNMRQYVEDWMNVNKQVKKLTFKDFKSNFDVNVTKQFTQLNNQLETLSQKAKIEGVDVSKDMNIQDLEMLRESAKSSENMKQILLEVIGIKQKVNSLSKEEEILNDKNFQRYVQSKEMLDGIKFGYDNISTSIDSILNSSSSMNPVLKDMLVGLNKFAGISINVASKMPDLVDSFQKSYSEAENNFDANFAGNLMSALSGNFIPALISMAPEIIEGIQMVWGMVIQTFFPNLDEKYQNWKREYDKKIIDLQESTDKMLLEKGDISQYLFNERSLERNAARYIDKLKDIEKEIGDMKWDAGLNMIGSKTLEYLNPVTGGIVGESLRDFAGIDSETEKKYKEQIQKIKEYEEALREQAKLEFEKSQRELAYTQKNSLRDMILEAEKESYELIVLYAENYGDKIASIKAKQRIDEISAEQEYNEAYKKLTVDNPNATNEEKLRLYQIFQQKLLGIQREGQESLLKNEIDLLKEQEDLSIRRLAINDNIGETSKKRAEINSKYKISLSEINAELETAVNADRESLIAQRTVLLAEKQHELAENYRESVDALRSFYRELQGAEAAVTFGEEDDALVAFNQGLDAVYEKMDALRKQGGFKEEDLKRFEKAGVSQAYRTYLESNLNAFNENAKDLTDIAVAEMEQAGDMVGSADKIMMQSAQEAVNRLEYYKLAFGETSDVFIREQRRTQTTLYNIAKENYDKKTDLYEQELNDFIEFEKLKAENAHDSFALAEKTVEGEIYLLMLQKENIKSSNLNEEQKRKKIELLDEKIKNARMKGVDAVGNATIEQLEEIRDIREQIYNDEIEIFQNDIDRNQKEIDGLNREIEGLNREKNAIEREIRDKQSDFEISDKEDFKNALAGMNLDSELRDALEYISNPIANSTFETAAEVAVEAAQAKLDLLKEEATTAYNLETINAEEYYNRLIQLELQRALVAKYALGKIEQEQNAELQRLRDAGKSEEELLIYEKRLLEERQKANRLYSDSYNNYQEYMNKFIEAGYQSQLKVIDKSIEDKEDEVQKKEYLNGELQDQINVLADEAESDNKKIQNSIDGVEKATRGWAFTTEQVKNQLTTILGDLEDKFAETSKNIQDNKFTLPIELSSKLTEQLQMIQALTGQNFSPSTLSKLTSDYQAQEEQFKTGVKTTEDNFMFLSGKNSSGYKTATQAGETIYLEDLDPEYLKSNRPTSSTKKEGMYILESPLTNRWYRTDDEMMADEEIWNQLGRPVGFKQGGMYSNGGIGGHADEIWARVRNNELVSPARDFRSFASDIRKDTLRDGRMYGGSSEMMQQNYFSFGNVYGVDELESTIKNAINKSNKDFGFSNRAYLSRNN